LVQVVASEITFSELYDRLFEQNAEFHTYFTGIFKEAMSTAAGVSQEEITITHIGSGITYRSTILRSAIYFYSSSSSDAAAVFVALVKNDAASIFAGDARFDSFGNVTSSGFAEYRDDWTAPPPSPSPPIPPHPPSPPLTPPSVPSMPYPPSLPPGSPLRAEDNTLQVVVVVVACVFAVVGFAGAAAFLCGPMILAKILPKETARLGLLGSPSDLKPLRVEVSSPVPSPVSN